jgi:hypothetical protein
MRRLTAITFGLAVALALPALAEVGQKKAARGPDARAAKPASAQERGQQRLRSEVAPETRTQPRAAGFVDADGDGICDSYPAGVRRGPGQRNGRGQANGQANAQGRRAGRRGGRGLGPGDGTGRGVGPADGTGYGAKAGACDGVGPRGRGRRAGGGGNR